jgi:glucuronate isomerase
MSYLKDNFLLKNKTAERLYFNFAKDMPIFDYHCHLPEKQILANEPFDNIYDIWLAGDHYKWRLMRNYGVDESYITGDKSRKEKFIAYCATLGTAFGNPLYHWSQLELKEFFNCEIEINDLRNNLREEEILKIEKNETDYQSSTYYIDLISELERMGDYIINVSEAL